VERQLLKYLFLLWIGLVMASSPSIAHEYSNENQIVVDPIAEVSLRFAAQWEISLADKAALNQKYGIQRVHFDPQGHPNPTGISSQSLKRWQRLYNLCMTDGCYYCDAHEGSCETGTCGPQNSLCKPYMDSQGCPKCGDVCADYAFAATLY